MFRKNKLSCAIVSAIGASIAANSSHAALEEVIVTATKRAQSQQTIPVAVTALAGDQLDSISSFQDYVQQLPNVVFQGTGPGQNKIFIRGAATSQTVQTLSSAAGLQPSVALYLDEMPVAVAGRNLDIYSTDMERVEVLPGPQGTLFGASSQAGTVRLITNKPNHDTFEAGFDLSYSTTKGGEASNSTEAYINIPFSDLVAVRVAGYTDHQGGWIDNVLNDPSNGGFGGSAVVIDRVSGGVLSDPTTITPSTPQNQQLVEDNFNDATYAGTRFGLSLQFSDDWKLLVQHVEQTLETEGVWSYDPTLNGESSTTRFNRDDNSDEFGLTTWTLNGRIGMLDLVYTGGFLDRDVNAAIDYTGYVNGGAFAAFYACSYGGTVLPADEACLDPTKFYVEETGNDRFTHEFRITTSEDYRIRGTAGLFYDEQELQTVGQFQLSSLDLVPAGGINATVPDVGGVNNPSYSK